MPITIESNADEVARHLNLKARQLRLAMRDGLEEVGKKVKSDYTGIWRTWNHRPRYEQIIDTAGGKFELLAGTDDDIFRMLDEGTRPHPIVPRRAKALRFLSGFRPKTQPNNLFSGHGGSFGDVVFSRFVNHPGTRARNWTKKIQQRVHQYGPKIMRSHLAKWTERKR